MNYWERLNEFRPEMFQAIGDTLIMMGIAMAASLLVGLPIGTYIFLSRKKGVAPNKGVYWVLNLYVDIVRSFPFLLFVVALIPLTRLVMGTAFGTYAAAFPLSFVGAAIYARLVEQVLLDVPAEILELAASLGATRRQLLLEFLFVEARSGLVLSFTSASISLVSYSTVMGIVGGGGIGDFAIRYGYQNYEYDIMYTTIVIMILFVFGIQLLGTTIARRIDKRK
ncbi:MULTISPECIES: methionine ABC transporter permease [Enterococcus]|uniref:methionine ABC transporter permease n=1 Tax=Enterococcus TaxID=1350 RepID=UPI00065E2551|nr:MULTISPECIES: methionine ABC transporter permease [Enterococcus]